ncbi:MAG: secretion protein [Burkholderiaceae bacterium]|uniref:Secretion protein n=1 Tax=Herminiimonas contaminans TaxID=1111140 RepID=A0ABS0EWN7_9BURK|nr:secretion protein [Herminiimonas contaminans]MBF8179251.1 secretion protein [Herminiimonas contaminans]MBX9798476.1 secretion protein [Burkholderiaceae bacterium]
MKKIHHKSGLRKICAAVALALTVMPAVAATAPAKSFVDMVRELPLVPAGMQDTEVLAKVTATVDAIKQMELGRANQTINEALQLDPRNSYLHFLNGFVYHLQARQGDTQKGEMALEGYQQALRIDPSNWIAQEFLGLTYMDLKQFDRAKLAFSDVLLMTPESSVSIYGLMVASYLTGDAKTACAMADQFQKTSTEINRVFVRSSISVYASCGNFAQAEQMRDALSKIDGGGLEAERADRRLSQWKAFYLKQEQTVAAAKGQPAAGMIKASWTQGASDERPQQLAQAFNVPSRPAPRPPSDNPTDANPAGPATPGATPIGDGTPVEAPANAAGGGGGSSGPRMLLIDVVLLSTQELITTSKGVNLLSALTLQLGSATNNAPAYSRVITSSSTTGGASTVITPPTVSTAITRAVSIPALTYSLNIANANSSVNEVLARPTLAAIEGLPSEFFSGTNLSAGVVSTSFNGGTTIVPLDKRFGIKLAVTPVFLQQGRVQMKVEAQRTALNASSDNPRVAYQIEIGEITANANVVMNMGDTLILSGLSEKSSSNTRDGVPGLQDVPGLQYLFSNKKTNDLMRSALILVTPRSPVQVSESPQEGDSMASRMKALRERFGFANSSANNIDAVMNQLQTNDYFREFRQGDVSIERWDRMRTTGDRLREALGFLYY